MLHLRATGRRLDSKEARENVQSAPEEQNSVRFLFHSAATVQKTLRMNLFRFYIRENKFGRSPKSFSRDHLVQESHPRLEKCSRALLSDNRSLIRCF